MTEELTALPNIGPVLADNLARIGVETPELLRAMGAREAFLRIRANLDPGACLHQLQALEGAVQGVKKSALPQQTKEALREFFRAASNGGRSDG